jgi:hypothetical protein
MSGESRRKPVSLLGSSKYCMRKKKMERQGMVVQACKPSYTRGGYRKIKVQGQSGQKS